MNHSIDHNLTGTARHTFNENFAERSHARAHLSYRAFRTFSVVGRTLISPKPFNILNTLTRDQPSDFQTESARRFIFGQLTTDLFNQLFLTAALRVTGRRRSMRITAMRTFLRRAPAWTFTNMVNPANVLTLESFVFRTVKPVRNRSRT